MADFSVGSAPKGNRLGLDFERVPILGNGGRRVNQFLDALLTPNLEDPSVPKGVGKKALNEVKLLPTIEFRAALDAFTGAGQRAGGPGDEIPRRYRIAPSAQEAADRYLAWLKKHKQDPQILPMWAADP